MTRTANAGATTPVRGIVAGLPQTVNLSGKTFESWTLFKQAVSASGWKQNKKPIVDLEPGKSFKVLMDPHLVGVSTKLEGFNKNSPFTFSYQQFKGKKYLVVTASKASKAFMKKDAIDLASTAVAPGART